jgi:hypothetical protein
MDYEALAKQYGGTVAAPVVDYDALARQFGGASASAAATIPQSEMVGQIPGQRSISQKEAPVSWRDRIMGVIETPAVLAGGAAASVAAPLAAMYGELTSPAPQGSPQARAAGEALAAKAREQFYQPRTQTSQQIMNAIAPVMEAGGAIPSVNALQMGQAAGPAMRAVQDTRAAQMGRYIERGQQAAAKVAQEQSAADWARAPKIEAAQAAQRQKIAINPAEANPNVKTKMLVGATGDAVVNEKAAKANMPRWNEIAREDLGLPENTPLDAKAFDKAREAHSGPYQKIQQIGSLTPDVGVLDQIEGLKLDPTLIGNADKVAKVNGIIDDALNLTASGMNGKQAVDNIRQLRNDASRTMRNQNASPIDLDVADAKLNIANALENLIESNIRDPKALNEFRAARTAMAKTYDWERVTGVTTKQIDPAEVVKLAEKGKPLSGALKDVADIAGNYPEIARLTTNKEPLLYQRLRRGGAGGTIGFAVGGGPVGAAIGAGITSLASEAAGNILARPGMQNRLAIPADRRIPFPQNKAPFEPIPQSNALTPYDYSQQTFVPPNFVMVNEPVPPRATFVGPETGGPAQLGYGGTMETLAAEKARAAQMSRTLGQQAEQRQAAAEAAARTPARGEVILDINPLTGVPEVSTGLKGATPAQFQNFGSSLKSASEKVAAGQNFAMDAAELAAWKRTTADLAEVMPGFKAMDDRVLAERMMDRKWVADALEKSRQKAAMFEDIAKRAADQQAKAEAIAKREQMLDLADTLEENLRGGRPVSKGGQGPKTRAHQRNMLSPEQKTQNQLIIEISGVGQRK